MAAERGRGPVRVRDDLTGLVPYGAPQMDAPVRLNTNETPWPPPAAFTEQVAKRLADLDLHRYPDRSAGRLREGLAARFGLTPERVWAANGSNEVLAQLFQAYGGPGRRALLFRPGYSAHPLIARVASTEVIEADLDADLRLHAATAFAAVEATNPDLICLASPNNPTGLRVAAQVVRALHDASRALVILDEAYVELSDDPGGALRLLDELERLVLVRTFSKAWRLAGLRLGYLLGHAWVVDDLQKVRLPYHLDAITQAAGEVALDLADEVTAHIPDLVAERQRVHAALEARDDVQTWPSQANFLLLRTGVDDLFDRLLEHGVLVRDFSTRPRLEGCVRVTVGSREENDAFLEALDAVLAAVS